MKRKFLALLAILLTLPIHGYAQNPKPITVDSTRYRIQSSAQSSPSPIYSAVTFTGTGVNDMTVPSPAFNLNKSAKLTVQISTPGTPDQFDWFLTDSQNNIISVDTDIP